MILTTPPAQSNVFPIQKNAVAAWPEFDAKGKIIIIDQILVQKSGGADLSGTLQVLSCATMLTKHLLTEAILQGMSSVSKVSVVLTGLPEF